MVMDCGKEQMEIHMLVSGIIQKQMALECINIPMEIGTKVLGKWD
jgi:hypothetical protein